jgi:amidohydrolase
MLQNDLIDALAPDIIALRHEIHRHPELGFAERRTADIIAARLAAAGLDVHRDLTETAVIGVLRNGSSPRRVMFRAELDALPVEEKADVPYRSTIGGRMHACGHDGHAAMLVGAAELLARTRSFDGGIVFVFQPAEEVHGGANRLLEAGLLERFPVDAAFALHNWPGVPEGSLTIAPGPRMAAVDDFTIVMQGKGAHAAMPELGDDPLLAAAELVTSAQRIVSRSVDPQSALVLSFTQIHGGAINNIVPAKVSVEGTCRFFRKDFSGHAEAKLRQIAGGMASRASSTTGAAIRRS